MRVSCGGRAPRGFVVGPFLDAFDKNPRGVSALQHSRNIVLSVTFRPMPDDLPRLNRRGFPHVVHPGGNSLTGPVLGFCMRLPTGLRRPRPLSRIRCQGAGVSDVILGCTCVKQTYRTPTRRPGRDTAMMLPHLSLDQRSALALIAGAGMNGVTEMMMLARGFTLAMLGVLVRRRLVIVQWKPVRVGGKMIEVGRFRITDTGRRALEGRSSPSPRPSEAQGPAFSAQEGARCGRR